MSRLPIRKKPPEGYQPFAVPKALKMMNGGKQTMETRAANSYTIVEIIVPKTLVGIAAETEFPGFHAKEEWLKQWIGRLGDKLPAVEFESENIYFIYHGAAQGPMVCVEWQTGTPVPEGLETVILEPQRFAVFMHKGQMVNQEQTFNNICDTDFKLNEQGIHFEMYSRQSFSEAGSDRFELPIYLPMAKKDGIH